MFPLVGTVERLTPHLPAALFAGRAMAALRALSRDLPAAITHWIDLECRLADGDAQVDLIVRIDRRGRRTLADFVPASSPAPRPSVPWQRALEFARAWDERPPLARAVTAMWLEFDVVESATAAAGSIEPRIFVDFHRDLYTCPASQLAPMIAVLDRLVGTPPRWLRDGLARCLRVLPDGACLMYLGVPAADRIDRVRLCVSGLDATRRRDYLRALAWSGTEAVLEEMSDLEGASGDGHLGVALLDLDLDARGIGAKLGCEFALARRPQVKGVLADAAFLERLVARGLCAGTKREALAHWPGCDIVRLPHEIWPSVAMRRVSHVKVVCDPPRALEAKAYLCWSHEWHSWLTPRSASVSSTPSAA